MEHTPGPWELTRSEKYNSLRVVGADGSAVASFGNQARWVRAEHLVANARLMAAAPKLLDLARAVDRHFRSEMGVDYSYYSQAECDLHKQAKAAIAEATAE